MIVRGRRWGSLLLAMGAKLMQEIEPLKLRATVKHENNASSSVFLRAGFTETASTSIDGRYRLFYREAFNTEKNDEGK